MTANLVPLTDYREYPVEEMRRRAATFAAELARRRSVRSFSTRAVPRDVIEHCLRRLYQRPAAPTNSRGTSW